MHVNATHSEGIAQDNDPQGSSEFGPSGQLEHYADAYDPSPTPSEIECDESRRDITHADDSPCLWEPSLSYGGVGIDPELSDPSDFELEPDDDLLGTLEHPTPKCNPATNSSDETDGAHQVHIW